MKLIIDISEEDYRECKFRKDLLSLGEEPTDLTFNMRMETLIANGTPLSEEIEKTKEEITRWCNGYLQEEIGKDINKIIDKHITELKGAKMICDLCPKAQQNLCDKYFILKPREECLMRKAQENKSIIEKLEKIKREMIEERDSADYLGLSKYLSCTDVFNWNIRLIEKHIAELKGE